VDGDTRRGDLQDLRGRTTAACSTWLEEDLSEILGR
jgi:hypothetical protein